MSDQYVNWIIEDCLAIVTIDCPEAKVNTLDEHLLSALETTAQKLSNTAGINAVLIASGKAKGFIAGADINIIESVTDRTVAEDMAKRGQQVFQLWADLETPVVAAINGHCLGGGLEYALACDMRIATPEAQLGLPEVRLGILPGFGGTQRLPRLIGLQKALELILTGRILSADKALRAGLVDKVVAEDDLLAEAKSLAQQATKRQPEKPSPKGWKQWLIEGTPFGRKALFDKSAAMVARQAGGHYPAPPRALDVIRQTWSGSLSDGLAMEAKALGELAVSKECKNLVHVYQLSQRAKRDPTGNEKPLQVKTAAVLGAGVMGSGIAWLLGRKGLDVTLKDIDETAIRNGLTRIKDWAEQKPSDANRTAVERIQGTIKDEEIAGSDLVIEAVLEKMPVKKAVIQQTETFLGKRAVFASNTSSLSISEMQTVSLRPGQIVGLHFFNPVDRMPLVEIIRGTETSEQTIATTFALANKLGKTPILVADSPGFLVNRLLVAYLNEACLLVDEGVEWQSLDEKMLDFGMPMGPFRLIDEVGIDIANEVGKILCKAFPYLNESPILQKVEDAGLLGRKNGLGFYDYGSKGRPAVNKAVNASLPESSRTATDDDVFRLVILMVAEAARCLQDGIVATAEDIDTGMVFGTGFPPFRGGLCRWADQLPEDTFDKQVALLSQTFGERFSFSNDTTESRKFYRT